mmetsp:Transcript_19602/g.46006  ORF Transcript_19602/g.46006 Transcript_19602/m.46006 type:complete len:441 (+) Transcript_19602:161-1483(+)
MRARRIRLGDAIPGEVRASDGDNNTHKKQRKSTVPLLAVVAVLCWVSIALLWSNGPMTPVPTGTGQSPKNSTSLGAAFVGANNRPRIPRRLVFTYKYNLLEGASPPPPLDLPLKINVLRTIDKYTKFWNMTDQVAAAKYDYFKRRFPEEHVEMPIDEVPVVSFLDDTGCLKVIEQADARLVDVFKYEERGPFKADICRVAELYMNGGWYFDIDIGVVNPIDFEEIGITAYSLPREHLKLLRDGRRERRPSEEDIVTFATVFNAQGRFFQAFTAATPFHPVLKRALNHMVAYYNGSLAELLSKEAPELVASSRTQKGGVPSRDKPMGAGVGPYTLATAFAATLDSEWEDYVGRLFQESGYVRKRGPGPRLKSDKLASRRHSRFLFESLLGDDTKGLFADVPLQDSGEKKIHWCNFVCFGGQKVYFYSRVRGSKGCPFKQKS